MNTYRVDQHVSLQFGVVQESLAAALMGTLEELIAVHCVVLLQTCPIVEDLAAALQGAPEDLGLLVRGSTCGSAAHHAARALFQDRCLRLLRLAG